MSSIDFTCPRTCFLAEECRFSPLWRAMGPSIVRSHTVTVQIDLSRSPEALKAAVEAMGGTWLGQGTHRLYERPEVGLGFQLPGWSYPLVARKGGLAYDDYHGAWGNVADIDRLQAAYALQAARQACDAQGWYVEETTDGLQVFHPSGGVLHVSRDGTTEAFGFEGVGCHSAVMTIADAIGRGTASAKPEFFAEKAMIRCSNDE